MADPPVVTPEDNANLANQAELADKASSALSGFSNVAYQAKNVFAELQNKVMGLGVSFKENQELTQRQSQLMGVLTTSLVGARVAFEGLSGVDPSGLNTFTRQIEDMKEVVLNSSPILTGLKKQLSDAVKGGADQGIISSLTQKIKEASDTVLSSAMAFAKSADNGLRLQNAMVQLSAKTGNLSAIYAAAGPHLEKINYLLQNQQKALNDAATATQLPIDAVEKYYSELGSIPKALDANVASSQTANKNVSMLTASIQYAAGSGRDYKDVITDLKVAFQNYNLVGQDALQFTARMGELSNKFGVELSDVQSSLRNTAENFKMFGNEAEGAARMMNQYLGALEDTKISGHVALGIVQQMTDGIKGLTIAQKGFLSAQTGGAGGLMGAFQIEKMLREGNLDGVMDKVKQTLTKQFGQITTLEEASKSPQAAAQLTKQMMMLRQGPLGSIVKDDQSAMRLLEAMKGAAGGRVAGAAGALSGTVVQDNMKIGVDLQKKSVTELSRIRAAIETARGQANIANLGTTQQRFTAGTGTPFEDADPNSIMRMNLSNAMQKGAQQSGDVTTLNSRDTKLKDVKDRSGVFAVQAVENFQSIFEDLEPALQGPIQKIKDLLNKGQGGKAVDAAQDLQADIERRKAEVEILPPGQRADAMADIRKDEEMSRKAIAAIPISTGMQGPKGLGGTSDLGVTILGPGQSAGDQVGQAAARSSAKAQPSIAAPGSAATPGTSHIIHPPEAPGMQTIRFEGICIDCQTNHVLGTAQLNASSPATKVRK